MARPTTHIEAEAHQRAALSELLKVANVAFPVLAQITKHVWNKLGQVTIVEVERKE